LKCSEGVDSAIPTEML